MAITVRYIYSACVVIGTKDVTLLCDPWFTEGIYDGSWFHFPKVDNPLESIGNVDAIYISHIHPDHYDPAFLSDYFATYGVKPVFIADHDPNYLAAKMKGDGIACDIVGADEVRRIGRTLISIMPHATGSLSDIDSALIVKYEADDRLHCVVNSNDIIFDAASREELKTRSGSVDILLAGYTGAGPYPQTYFDLDDPALLQAANDKKKACFERYRKLTAKIDARVNIPFAGKYMLGGRLTGLNDFRGVADPVEVLAFDERAVVLSDNGGTIDTESLTPNGIRTAPYGEAAHRRRESEIRDLPMAYERLIREAEIHQLPLRRLLSAAARNACRKSEVDRDYFFCIHLPDDDIAVVNANRNATASISFQRGTAALPTPRSEITIDPRCLFGLLTGVYHWNNADVGSHFFVRRIPNEFDRRVQRFLNFLCL
jgi:UDP-MurNAc hydroxylase